VVVLHGDRCILNGPMTVKIKQDIYWKNGIMGRWKSGKME
jgi:hypothetical protein